jgi:4-carboxymuconolactone decarboxylase
MNHEINIAVMRRKIMTSLIMIISLSLLFASVAFAGSEKSVAHGTNSQVVYQAWSQKSFKGPEEFFTGDVQVEMLFPANETAHYSGAYVIFQPGARTAWHLHPAGQHMVVTSGVGLTGTRDGKIVTFKEGDAIWCPPDIDHWHGATPDSPMTHLVITGDLGGKNVVWK